jgi:hypothetical protein
MEHEADTRPILADTKAVPDRFDKVRNSTPFRSTGRLDQLCRGLTASAGLATKLLQSVAVACRWPLMGCG